MADLELKRYRNGDAALFPLTARGNEWVQREREITGGDGTIWRSGPGEYRIGVFMEGSRSPDFISNGIRQAQDRGLTVSLPVTNERG